MGWRALHDEKLYDVMHEMACDSTDPVGIAVLPRGDNYHEPHLYGAAFNGVPADFIARIDHPTVLRAQVEAGLGGVRGDIIANQLAILSVCTAQVHGRKAIKAEEL